MTVLICISGYWLEQRAVNPEVAGSNAACYYISAIGDEGIC